MKKLLAVLLAAVLVASALPFTVFAAEGDDVLVISENGSYTIDATQTNPVDISGVNGTVTLDNACIKGGDETNPAFKRSAIVVKDYSDVTFRLVGTSEIEGYTDYSGANSIYSCGIQVEYGSKVTFEGEGTLNVRGGKYGAAIGSWGTRLNIPYEERSLVGEITINSGNINAYGGTRGAGIGSGYHVNGNKITINGGTVHAYGRECAAGIGTGYGTSGGSELEGAGGYDAGTIIINGGEVYASANYVEDIEHYDYSNFDALNAADQESFGAGIGGGYGACVSSVEINGGKVFALGSCGGAGIGGGRGASKAKNYKDINDEHSYKVNIKIGGDAQVTAVTANRRTAEDDGGAAAIGAGRGTHSVGNIEITDNAKVIAVSPSKSPAIGVSTTVKYPITELGMPHAESIIIGDNVTLFAVSAGEYAVDKDAKNLQISPNYFGSSDRWFFDEPAVAITDITNVKAESPKGEKTYEVPAGSVSLWANIVPPVTPVVTKANLNIVAPLAMALRFEDGGVYYSGDSVEVEVGKEYKFQMCTVDWTTRSVNGEKKIHKPYETFYPSETAWQHTNHGVYEDGVHGFRGSVVYTVTLDKDFGGNTYDAANKAFTLHKGNYTLRTDTNNCFMAYRFYYDEHYNGKATNSMEYRVTTGIDNVLYDIGSDHKNTLEDFRYTKPLSALSINLPLGATVTAKEYIDDVFAQEAQILVTIDEANPGECYKNYYWKYANQ